uniref:PAH-inducible cytochrome P450 monooxygenase PC-PAH 5 n=1 Tax=Phanerodontia chrysosporium TaxID=2822231 RepID=A9JR52_PHACH|nr:PAH-inducible cytochrome P450 monooxygenase PC-PAH 5 [Phanerodontia chrysosporium]
MDVVRQALEGRTTKEYAGLALLAFAAYVVANIIYNLYFHPLAKFPGPRAAAASRWWKAYVEVYKGESIVDRLFELHAEYGDVVRITPDELHFSDPKVYNEIYNTRSRWDKDGEMYAPFGGNSTMFTALRYHDAKKRRDLTASLFSRKSVLSLQGSIQEGLDELCDIISARSAAGKTTDLFRAFRCLNLDNVTSFCFGWSLHTVRAPDFRAPPLEEVQNSHGGYQFWKHLMLFRAVLLPKLKEQVDALVARPDELEAAPHPIIFHSLIDPAHGAKLSAQELMEEANMFIVAGIDTTSNATGAGVIGVLSNPSTYDKLKTELRTAWPRLDEKPTVEVFESLPYLKAVCKEALRLSHGITSPMLRIVPPQGATLAERFVPGGTQVGVSHLFVHLNPTLFPDPHAFRPERWLEPGAESLDTWLVAFSKGPRSCLGINLGWCELYLNIANLFRRFDLKLEGRAKAFLDGPRARASGDWKDCFLPCFEGPDMLIHTTPVAD